MKWIKSKDQKPAHLERVLIILLDQDDNNFGGYTDDGRWNDDIKLWQLDSFPDMNESHAFTILYGESLYWIYLKDIPLPNINN